MWYRREEGEWQVKQKKTRTKKMDGRKGGRKGGRGIITGNT